MSLNRFETTSVMISIKPDVLASWPRTSDLPVTVIVDIAETWTLAATADIVRSTLADHAAKHGLMNVFLRIDLPGDAPATEAIGGVATLGIAGFVLSGVRCVADIQRLDTLLRVTEAENGLTDGSLLILAEIGAVPAMFLSTRTLRNVSARLEGLVFDGAGLATATASTPATHDRPGAPALFGRAAAVILARQANLPCHELLADESHDRDALQRAHDAVIRDGFSGLVARTAAQLRMLATL